MTKDSYLRIILIGTLTFLVSGCGGTWQHSYKKESTFYTEKNSCIAEANRVFPPLMSTPSSYGNNSTRTTCTSSGSNTVDCTTSDRFSGYPSYSYDTNESARSNYADDCLKSKGWYFAGNTTKIGKKNFNLTNGWLSWD